MSFFETQCIYNDDDDGDDDNKNTEYQKVSKHKKHIITLTDKYACRCMWRVAVMRQILLKRITTGNRFTPSPEDCPLSRNLCRLDNDRSPFTAVKLVDDACMSRCLAAILHTPSPSSYFVSISLGTFPHFLYIPEFRNSYKLTCIY